MEFMQTMPDDCVDLILTDPPYNISQYSTGNIPLPGREALNNDIAKWDDVPLEPSKLLYDFKRILKSNGNIFVFTSYNMIGKISNKYSASLLLNWRAKSVFQNAAV